MNFKEIACIVILFLLSQAPLNANNTMSSTHLRQISGSYAPALGNAFTAYSASASALTYNPAGLAFSSRNEFEFTQQSLPSDVNMQQINFSIRGNQHNEWGHGFGIGAKKIDYGKQGRITYHTSGSVLNSKSSDVNIYDREYMIGYATRFRKISIGITINNFLAKQSQSNVEKNQNYSNIGFQYRVPYWNVSYGLTIKNFNPSLQKEQKIRPTTTTGGISKTWLKMIRANLELANVQNKGDYVQAGVEIEPRSDFFIRAGYDERRKIGTGLSYGFGYRTNSLIFDYMLLPFTEFDNQHNISIRFRF